ncbi:MAG: spermidine/putrescine ABC transporter substrate-binding protein [Eubacterium sp.]|nr:spermidine/putrescine ABC transporter substrate-binding protein [Eubacterium sp.]
MLVIAAAAALLLGACGGAKDGDSSGDAGASSDASAYGDIEGTTLNLYTWADMFPREVLDGFEDEYGVTIEYSNFDYNEDMLAKLEESEGGDYDLVVADDYILEMINEEGLAAELDKGLITGYDNINANYLGLFYDPENLYDIPYGAGIPLIVYNPELTDVDIKGYGDLWDSALEDNVAVIGNYRVIDGMALKVLGESMNTEDVSKIEAAGEKLLELAPNIRAINDTDIANLLVSGEVAAAYMYTSQVTEALKANDSLVAVYPEEGLGFGTMAQFIPVNAPNPAAAYAFIDYVLRPEVSAACFEYIGYYCTNEAAEEYISDEMREYVVVPATASDGEAIENISTEAEDAHAKVWAEFKAQCD